jgi:hypothetical protein
LLLESLGLLLLDSLRLLLLEALWLLLLDALLGLLERLWLLSLAHLALGLLLLEPLGLLLLETLGLLLCLLSLLGLLLWLDLLLSLSGRSPATDELPALSALGHLVGLLGLAVLGLELLGELLWRHSGTLGLLGGLLLGQTDLLVNLALGLFALLFVLLWFLHELPRLWVPRLQFGLNGLVLAERLRVTPVACALVCTASLLGLSL